MDGLVFSYLSSCFYTSCIILGNLEVGEAVLMLTSSPITHNPE